MRTVLRYPPRRTKMMFVISLAVRVRRSARATIGTTWYDKRVNTEISGPEWGIVLGPEHLKRIDPDPTVFPTIRNAGSSKAVFLSPDPEDVMSEAFDARLDAARKALAPLLMDVSKVPVS